MTDVTAYELAQAWDAWLAHTDDHACGPLWLRVCKERMTLWVAALEINARAISEHRAYVDEALQQQGEMSAGRRDE